MKNLIDWFKENNPLLKLFLLLVIFAWLLISQSNQFLSGLGNNLLSNFIAAGVTVFGIDFVIRRREAKRLIPLKAAVYEDIRVMTHWALDLWKDVSNYSIGDESADDWETLFSEDALKKAWTCFDINTPANTYPPMSWADHLDSQMSKIHKHAERCMERHGHALDPEVHRALYTIVYYEWYPIRNLINLDTQMGTPRPKTLLCYAPMLMDWFNAILTLNRWTKANYPLLTKDGVLGIHLPYEKPNHQPANFRKAQIEISVLNNYFKIFQDWQNAQKNEVA